MKFCVNQVASLVKLVERIISNVKRSIFSKQINNYFFTIPVIIPITCFKLATHMHALSIMFGHVFHVTMKGDFLLSFLEEDGKVFCWGWNKYGQVLMLNPQSIILFGEHLEWHWILISLL